VFVLDSCNLVALILTTPLQLLLLLSLLLFPQWRSLQQSSLPTLLRSHFSWLNGTNVEQRLLATLVDTVEHTVIGMLVPPVPVKPFLQLQENAIASTTNSRSVDDNEAVQNNVLDSTGGAEQCGFLHLVVDGVVFQTQVCSNHNTMKQPSVNIY
jgi:hypothetical protein